MLLHILRASLQHAQSLADISHQQVLDDGFDLLIEYLGEVHLAL